METVLSVTETPLSLPDAASLAALRARAGAVILPPSPGFYHRPQTVAEVVEFVVARVLDQLAVPHTLMQRWGE